MITIQIDDQPVTFRFSMLTLQIFGETCGETDIRNLEKHFDRLRTDLRAMGSLLYAAARADYEIKGQPCLITPAVCVEWIGLMSPKEVEQVFDCFSKSRYIKNVMGALPKAPK